MEEQRPPSRPRGSPVSQEKSRSSISQLSPPETMAASSKDAAGASKGGGGMSGLLAQRMAEGGGALCNDRNGLLLGSRGDIDASKSGVYTAISKLAGQLDSTEDGSGVSHQEVPLVSIQTEKATLLVKEYSGRTVVFRCPNEATNSTAAGAGEVKRGSDDAAKSN